MKEIKVGKKEYTGVYVRWNMATGRRRYLPTGVYFKNGSQFIEGLEISEGNFSPSSKHSFINVRRNV